MFQIGELSDHYYDYLIIWTLTPKSFTTALSRFQWNTKESRHVIKQIKESKVYLIKSQACQWYKQVFIHINIYTSEDITTTAQMHVPIPDWKLSKAITKCTLIVLRRIYILYTNVQYQLYMTYCTCHFKKRLPHRKAHTVWVIRSANFSCIML